ncbi:MAG: NDP-sugar synthase [Eubacteriales bacterium]
MTLVILAAGMGSRYGGMKQIDPINKDGNFIIDFSIYDAVKSGFDKVIFIIKEENLSDFKETIGNRISKYIQVEYAFQRLHDLPEWFDAPSDRKKPWGTNQALLSVANIVKEPFAVINSDDFYGRETFEIIANHLKKVENAKGKPQFCMAGYRLGNTVTEHGAVNRGVCNIGADGRLKKIVETKEIVPDGKGKAVYPVGNGVAELDLDTVVSMNCWGFTPELFGYIEAEFDRFLHNVENPMKDESYLTDTIDSVIESDACDVIVYNTNASWLGVTYPDDKPGVVAGINKLVNEGVYPEHLWK